MDARNEAPQLARLIDIWSATRTRDAIVERAGDWLDAVGPVDDVCELVRALNVVTAVHPLDVVGHLLDTRPHLLPGVRRGDVIEDRFTLTFDGLHVDEPCVLHIPSHFIVERFGVLGAELPGAAFFPTLGDGDYVVQMGTSGRRRIAVLAVVAVQLGALKRATQASVLDELEVTVHP